VGWGWSGVGLGGEGKEGGGLGWGGLGPEAYANRTKCVLGRFRRLCFTSHQSGWKCRTNINTNNMLLQRRKRPMEKQSRFQANKSRSSE